MDRDAASLMGIRVERIYAVTFGIGALMAGACGSLLAVVYPVTTMMADQFLGKAFVVCVIGGLGSVPGALAGGIALGLIESVSGNLVGPQHAMTIGFSLMILLSPAAHRPPRHTKVPNEARPDDLYRLHSSNRRGSLRCRQLCRTVMAYFCAWYVALALSWNVIGGTRATRRFPPLGFSASAPTPAHCCSMPV